MNRVLLAGLPILLVCAAAWTGEALMKRIEERAESVRAFQELYEARADVLERRTLLEQSMAEAAWLEQVGGMKSARADALLALARWGMLDGASPEAAPSFGFLGDEAGVSRPSMLVRPPGGDELPAGLARYKDRLLFIQLHNESAQPVLLGRPFVEMPGHLGESKWSELGGVDTWPADLKALSKWGAWPARLDANRKAVLLAWLAPEQTGVLSLVVPVRWNEEDEPSRSLRAVFLTASYPDDVARARRVALQREVEIKKNLAKSAAKNAPEPRPVPVVVPPPKPQPSIVVEGPPAVGKVDRAGNDQMVQVQLNDPSIYRAGKELRVRKNGRWTGIVRLNETSDRDPNKKIYWATILEGVRLNLEDGSLHETP